MSRSPRLRIPARAAVRLQLEAQGLDRPLRRRATKADVLDAVRRMGALQIDTIHVVARSPYLVLWSRLGAYDPSWLDELLAEGKLFEYWAHEACFLPRESYGWFRRRMIDPGSLGWKYSHEWLAENRDVVRRVLAGLRERPVRSADFAAEQGRTGGWWGWKPEKRALEMLFSAGEVMVARRERFQRVYDLRERVYPGWTDEALPSAEETECALVRHTVGALGVARATWIADYFRMPRSEASRAIDRLLRSGELLPVEVEGWPEAGLVLTEHERRVRAAAAARGLPTHTTLLSPFDPLVWDRARTRALFGFDYRLECYTPQAKRVYGYFVLPILRRGRLVGRLDAKAHRKEGVMEVRSCWLEDGIRPSAALTSDIARALARFAEWHATPRVRVRKTRPAGFGHGLRQALASMETRP